MKRMKTTMTALAAAVMAMGLAGCGNAVEKISNDVIGEQSGSGEIVSIGKETFDGTKFDEIRIDTQAAMIELRHSGGKEATVELAVDREIENEFELHAGIREGRLEIEVEEEDAKDSLFSFEKQDGQRKLIVNIPAEEMYVIDVRGEFGAVEATGIRAEELQVHMSAGVIRVENVSARMNLRTEAGNIEVSDLKLEQDLKAVTEAGNITVRFAELPESAKLFLESEVGKVTSKLEGIDYSVEEWNEKIGKIGSGGPRLEASTEVGSISIK